MSGLQAALLAGAAAGLGVALIVWRLVPAQPHLGAALDRLDPTPTTPTSAAMAGGGVQDRLGIWVQRHLAGLTAIPVPRRELALLRISVHRYYGEKAGYVLLGLVFPPLAGLLFTLAGAPPPVALPAAASLGLAVVLSFIPDYNARSDAKAAREEFTRALGAYIDLVALARLGGAGATGALEVAAQVGDSWVFQRLREELARSRWSGIAPWDALAGLAEELGLSELADLADIMRLSGEEGTTVYATLRARAASLRNALLTSEHARANAAGEKMTMPVAALALIFMVLLATPAVLRVTHGN